VAAAASAIRSSSVRAVFGTALNSYNFFRGRFLERERQLY
jgi:hypothetical protein